MEKNASSRREFIGDTLKTGIGTAIGLAAISTSITSCKVFTPAAGASQFRTGFTQQPLPYSYNALDRSIDGMTMEIHYSRHAAGYATNLQDAAKNENVDMSKPLEEVFPRISKLSTKMRNNAGGHYNHELFWKCMAPEGGGKPTGKLLTVIEETYSSFDSFKTQFSDAGKNRFGSGWSWLVLDVAKKLRIGSTANQDNPLMDVVNDIKGNPLLALDVWEHAYYLRYQNKRADYVNAWWNVVNWKHVQQRYEAMI